MPGHVAQNQFGITPASGTGTGVPDDPRQAVPHPDELGKQMLKSLASNFAEQRSRSRWAAAGRPPNTENLRMALRSYRSFFERLLSL